MSTANYFGAGSLHILQSPQHEFRSCADRAGLCTSKQTTDAVHLRQFACAACPACRASSQEASKVLHKNCPKVSKDRSLQRWKPWGTESVRSSMLSESSEQLTKYCKSYFIVKGGTCWGQSKIVRESVSACWTQSMTVTDEQSQRTGSERVSNWVQKWVIDYGVCSWVGDWTSDLFGEGHDVRLTEWLVGWSIQWESETDLWAPNVPKRMHSALPQGTKLSDQCFSKNM